jgi:hypothetical protein
VHPLIKLENPITLDQLHLRSHIFTSPSSKWKSIISFPWVKKTTMNFFGCPNVYFYGFEKYYYIVPQLKHLKNK